MNFRFWFIWWLIFDKQGVHALTRISLRSILLLGFLAYVHASVLNVPLTWISCNVVFFNFQTPHIFGLSVNSKAVSILMENLNSGLRYLITTVPNVNPTSCNAWLHFDFDSPLPYFCGKSYENLELWYCFGGSVIGNESDPLLKEYWSSVVQKKNFGGKFEFRS